MKRRLTPFPTVGWLKVRKVRRKKQKETLTAGLVVQKIERKENLCRKRGE